MPGARRWKAGAGGGNSDGANGSPVGFFPTILTRPCRDEISGGKKTLISGNL
jgi:hypothetical protein